MFHCYVKIAGGQVNANECKWILMNPNNTTIIARHDRISRLALSSWLQTLKFCSTGGQIPYLDCRQPHKVGCRRGTWDFCDSVQGRCCQSVRWDSCSCQSSNPTARQSLKIYHDMSGIRIFKAYTNSFFHSFPPFAQAKPEFSPSPRRAKTEILQVIHLRRQVSLVKAGVSGMAQLCPAVWRQLFCRDIRQISWFSYHTDITILSYTLYLHYHDISQS